MTNNDYIQFCKSLDSNNLQPLPPKILHAILGIAGEAGELIDSIKKSTAYHQPIDYINLKEEVGDLLHYIARLIETCGWTFEDIMLDNTKKLNLRYPHGFTCADAILRRDKNVQTTTNTKD